MTTNLKTTAYDRYITFRQSLNLPEQNPFSFDQSSPDIGRPKEVTPFKARRGGYHHEKKLHTSR